MIEQQFKVGKITIRKERIEEREYLTFEADPHAKKTTVVILAIFVIAKFLRWWDGSNVNENQNITITYSNSHKRMFIDGWEVMNTIADGRVIWARFNKYHLNALMNMAITNQLPHLITPDQMRLWEIVTIEKIDSGRGLPEKTEEWLEKAFIGFVRDNCPVPGKYELDFDWFCQKVRLPGKPVWNFLSDNFEQICVDGQFIRTAYCDGKKMIITIV